MMRGAAVPAIDTDAELLDRVRRFAQTPTATKATSELIHGFNEGEKHTLKRLREILGIEE